MSECPKIGRLRVREVFVLEEYPLVAQAWQDAHKSISALRTLLNWISDLLWDGRALTGYDSAMWAIL